MVGQAPPYETIGAARSDAIRRYFQNALTGTLQTASPSINHTKRRVLHGLRAENISFNLFSAISADSAVNSILSLERELIFEYGLEIVDIVEVVYRIGGLGAHPLVLYHEVDDFAEIVGGFEPPRVEN